MPENLFYKVAGWRPTILLKLDSDGGVFQKILQVNLTSFLAEQLRRTAYHVNPFLPTAQKMKFSIKNFFSLNKSAVSCGFGHIC